MLRRTPSLRSAALALLGVAITACQPKIGDSCDLARDCSLFGERQCDLSYAPFTRAGRGECTIENCSAGSCPDEAVCVKIYGSDFLSVACDPDREDLWTECSPGETVTPATPTESARICPDDGLLEPEDLCTPSEICLPEGLCADEISARTSCRLECRRDSDCRKAYECKRVGTNGIYVAPRPKKPTEVRTARICVPRGAN